MIWKRGIVQPVVQGVAMSLHRRRQLTSVCDLFPCTCSSAARFNHTGLVEASSQSPWQKSWQRAAWKTAQTTERSFTLGNGGPLQHCGATMCNRGELQQQPQKLSRQQRAAATQSAAAAATAVAPPTRGGFQLQPTATPGSRPKAAAAAASSGAAVCPAAATAAHAAVLTAAGWYDFTHTGALLVKRHPHHPFWLCKGL